jgi:hypothetical protein
MTSRLICLAVIASLLAACATETVKSVAPASLPEIRVLAFLRDDETTREDVLLRLGVPTAQLEGDRILMYQLNTDAKGRWYLSAPEWNSATGMRTWRTGTSSLVLVFDEAGVLRRHSLVVPGTTDGS